MGLLGRLLFPQIAVLKFIDTAAIRAAGDYDDDFRELKLTDADGDGIGEENRVETEARIKAQVATRTFDRLFQAEHGQVPESPNLELTLHFRDLIAAGLVESGGRAKIIIGTRLERIEDLGGNTVITFPNPPGMFCTAARPSGFLGGTRNLWVCTFSDRRQSSNEPPRTSL